MLMLITSDANIVICCSLSVDTLHVTTIFPILIAVVDGLTGFPDAKCRTLWFPLAG